MNDENQMDIEEEGEDIVPMEGIKKLMIFSSRKVDNRTKSLMFDLQEILPHSKKSERFDDEKYSLTGVKDILETNKITEALFFRYENDEVIVYMSRYPSGPTVRLKMKDIVSLQELHLSGNCIKFSRPILHFDANFDLKPHTKIVKELFIQSFSSPAEHPLNKPFVDHIICFYLVEGNVVFRNYQIVTLNQAKTERRLVEIGPRFTAEITRITSGSFEGNILYNNESFIPNKIESKIINKRVTRELETKEEKKKNVLNLVTREKNDVDAVFSEKIDDDEIDFAKLKYESCSNPHCKKRESFGVKFQVCGKCLKAKYCSRECQVADYKSHKNCCVEPGMEKVFNKLKL